MFTDDSVGAAAAAALPRPPVRRLFSLQVSVYVMSNWILCRGRALFLREESAGTPHRLGKLYSSMRVRSNQVTVAKNMCLHPAFFIASCYSCSLKQAGPWSTLFPKPKRRPESHEHLNYPSSPPSSPSNLSGSIDFLQQQQQRRVRVEMSKQKSATVAALSF